MNKYNWFSDEVLTDPSPLAGPVLSEVHSEE